MLFHWLRHGFTCVTRPVYVVAGFQRSGTTAMMRALEAGGIPADRAPEGDRLRDDYELSAEQRDAGWDDANDWDGLRWPAAHRGHAVKGLVPAARYMDERPNGLRVLFMVRPPRAIQASARLRHGRAPSLEAIAQSQAAELDRWLAREHEGDVCVRTVEYDALVAEPLREMRMIAEAGFPINPVRAAETIDPSRRHHIDVSAAPGAGSLLR